MNIVSASNHQIGVIMRLFRSVTRHLRKKGVYQWDLFYPNRWVVSKDVKNKQMYVAMRDQLCVGAVVINEEQSAQYDSLPWQEGGGRPAVIHRLAVHPEHQGQGIGKQLLYFAEEQARAQGCTSIRLDAYTANPAALQMYERAGYSKVGLIRYPFRKEPYQCYEKKL
ncbi:GNAT family N-acetyltransferase [Paenibacillus chartarius]|uniref:GNAT family N-acetyltransferase n=1 Tax=Paenibacillus chartarius TaxID=747481 RepID=A0ABV6DEH5_9BACL